MKCARCRRHWWTLVEAATLVVIGSVLGYLFAAVVLSRAWLHG
jgi:hypothetical protein